ncbi:MAG: DUF5107 domain-containing protein [Bacillota bacterium]
MITNRSLRLAFCAVLALAGFFPITGLADASVQMTQQSLVIPTYRTGQPEKNPIFFTGRSYQGAKGPIYPYPLLDKLSDTKEDKTYRAIYLENPYVQYCVLPEIGGRIFTGLDKTNKYDFIYRQHVIKPALIGMVGAWISGGVEWNIPHHHRASTFMTVDHKTVENADGSKTVWVGEIELRHRMKWLVGMTLYPDKSYLKVTVKLFNRTPLPHSLLYFANIAVHANPDYQVIFPPATEFGTQHGKSEFVNWPIGRGFYGGQNRNGIDVSWWKNLPTPASIFCWNYEDDFFGGYDHGKQAGIAVIADHHNAPGKKFFEWGNGPEGLMWDKILTDTDGPYLELMAGGYSDNQPDYSWIQPTEVKVVEQYYYPIRELGGIKNANRDAAVNLDIKNSTARLAFNTTSEQRNATVLLQTNGNTLLQQQVTIAPDRPFAKEVPLPPNTKPEDLRVSLLTLAGKELIAYRPAKAKNSPMPKRVEPPPAPKDIKTNEELYLAGLRLEQFHSPALEPYPYYEEALRRDPGDYRANVALGILYCKRAMYEQAQEKLTAAVQRVTRNYTSPKDTEAFYYLGVAERALGNVSAATNAFQKAAWSPAWYAPSNYALAELACRGSDYPQALEFINRSLAANALNTRALALKTALLRKLGQKEQAQGCIAAIRDIDPLDHHAANEQYLARPDDKAGLESVTTLMRHEVSAYLELAVDYGNAGLYDEAIDVLSRFARTAGDSTKVNPLIHYYLGYYWEQKADNQKALNHYKLAAQMPADYCFPFQLESIDVFQHAIACNPSDARAPYYLGNLIYDLQPQVAVRYWEQSRQLDATFATVHRNLGFAYARIERDNGKAIASLEKAIACDAKDPKFFAELDALYEAASTDPAKRLAMLEKNHDTVSQRDDALLREISLHILLGNYDRAIALLGDHHFRLWEGETGTHDIYADAHMLRGQRFFQAKQYAEALKDFEAAGQYPDRFETAKPTRTSGKLIQVSYFLGTVYEALGQADKARSYYEQATQGSREGSDLRYYQALAHGKLNQEDKATQIFNDLIRTGQDRLKATEGMDFFAKFGTRQSATAQRANAHYQIGLGHLGKREFPEAKEQFESALKLNAAHLGARTMLATLARQ